MVWTDIEVLAFKKFFHTIAVLILGKMKWAVRTWLESQNDIEQLTSWTKMEGPQEVRFGKNMSSNSPAGGIHRWDGEKQDMEKIWAATHKLQTSTDKVMRNGT